MFDKLQTVKNYIFNVQEKYENIVNTCTSYTNNLILINSNTPYSTKLLYKYLNREGITVVSPSLRDVLNYNSLGEFLRLQSIDSINNTVLVLDIFGELNEMFFSVPEAVDTININRDLFTEKFDSTIIVASQKLTYAIRRNARDFWSCVNIFVDTTKWFCTPVMLPIVSMKVNTNATSYLIDIYKKNRIEYMKFVELGTKIKLNLKQYNHRAFTEYYNEIKKFSLPARIELIKVLSESMISAETGYSMYDTKRSDMCELANDKEANIDIIIALAEYFFKCEEYFNAKCCYQRAYLHLMETWDNEIKNYILAFLSCNILICKYMQQGKHSPRDLESDLRVRFELIESDLEIWQEDFKEDYLFLINATVRHHTYAQHRDILERLRNIKTHSTNMLSFEIPFDALFIWEEFNANEFGPVMFKLKDPVLTEIHLNLQSMIRNFCNGYFYDARNAYKIARKQARIHGYMQILKFAEVFNDNMMWLYNEATKK